MMLGDAYYQQEDVLFLSRDLLGKHLMSCVDGVMTGGMIIETEAYRAPDDRASHAYGGRRTARNDVMYGQGGIAYVYLCYGIHALFNVVTHKEGIPHAILIRAIQPTEGVEAICQRRKKRASDKTLTNGPGTLTQALGITTQDNGTPLTGPKIWIEDRGDRPKNILTTPRIGIDYAGEDALLPWRFVVEG